MTLIRKLTVICIAALLVTAVGCKEKSPAEKAADEVKKATEEVKKAFD